MYAIPTYLHELRRKGVFSPLVESAHVSVLPVSFPVVPTRCCRLLDANPRVVVAGRYTQRSAFGQIL
ncbi:Piso0_001404 [Millerozyma farinosa CBS 7064]|uniref:Piso0_001404 protein n=1 Tax=Pichia sorbitophila (strain ATCC MYA-4447 / BCRC 22081 / CBS 7064 / NBRC 10061 / NRRL Y-12695) TaxID=559304 RepID=G8YKP8_PICSO|nr:Piso0_001404 [Millerozyma farinosa CBS 7064]